MVGESFQNAIQDLKSERDRIDAAIAYLEGLSGGKRARGAAVTVARRVGRGARKAAAGAAPRGRKRRNAPRGLLKAKIHEVLQGTKGPLAPVKLRDAVLAAGYPSRNPKSLYTAIFTAASQDSELKKTKEGFSLR